MATSHAHGAGGEMPCPDPSVHEKHNRLSEQASTAALLATQPDRATASKEGTNDDPLGADGKLSSRSMYHDSTCESQPTC